MPTTNDERSNAIVESVALNDGVLYSKKSGKPVKLWRDRNGYLYFKVGPIRFSAHRAIWFLHYGAWPKHTIDHINGVGSDNRIENLRDVPQSVNARNKGKDPRNTTGVCGVYRNSHGCPGWRASIQNRHLGCFRTIEEATAARRAAERRLGYTERHGKPCPPNSEHGLGN